jgi:hypothetical protein
MNKVRPLGETWLSNTHIRALAVAACYRISAVTAPQKKYEETRQKVAIDHSTRFETKETPLQSQSE